MTEAPANALVLKARCPVCDEWTVTCQFWSEKLREGGVEGQGDESKSCDCPVDDLGYLEGKTGNVHSLIDICCAAYDRYIGEQENQR